MSEKKSKDLSPEDKEKIEKRAKSRVHRRGSPIKNMEKKSALISTVSRKAGRNRREIEDLKLNFTDLVTEVKELKEMITHAVTEIDRWLEEEQATEEVEEVKEEKPKKRGRPKKNAS